MKSLIFILSILSIGNLASCNQSLQTSPLIKNPHINSHPHRLIVFENASRRHEVGEAARGANAVDRSVCSRGVNALPTSSTDSGAGNTASHPNTSLNSAFPKLFGQEN